ncbi:helix-turn-helix transcriptional regulator [Flavobacterium aciduliphilum]|uniref:Putative DNA-binding transcriptional regulator YafY n=1 Tax=Flavobacterium aciduliphilum TaxID=1101402 RepID=A0A328YKF7_9FLAO|nr:WYL domain-containing protein [Flavobacterium aciduliphilum]RAR73794.1 putative DNA-binding transcriptional regulator YafY [Flavobacterium aciduliphilum]
MDVSKSAYSRYRVIDKMLKNTFRPYPTLLDIQEACERSLDKTPSLDTLEKDIRNMKQSEVFEAPIVYCRKNLGYYYSNPNYSINSIPLTDNDISSIKEALDLVKNLGGGNRINERFSDAIQKILATYKEEFPDSDTKRKIIQTDYVEGAKGYENFNILFNACKNQNPISFVHYSYTKREFKSVIVHPIRLKEFENRWYLIGYSEHHHSIRTFGLDRMYEVVRLRKKYIESDSDEIERYCTAIYGVYPIENQAQQIITFLTSISITNYFEAYPIHPSQTAEKNESGSCYFTINVVPSMELVRMFRSYGSNLKVVYPLWLKEQIKSL